MLKTKLNTRYDFFMCLTMVLTEVSKIFCKSVSFLKLPGFYAGIFYDFVIFTKELLKIFVIVFSLDVTRLLVLRVS